MQYYYHMMVYEVCVPYVTGVQAVTNFITVAIDTGAGGDDHFAHDRYIALRAIANGFGVLVYGLNRSANFTSLFKSCETVWEAIHNDSELLTKLVRQM